MNKSFPLFALLLLLTGRALAQVQVSEPADLGDDLAYIRVHSLADSAATIKSVLAVNHACVIDIRYATATDTAIASLRAALAGRPVEASLFILISPATPTGLIEAVNPKTPVAYVTLGIEGSKPSPKIAVKTAAETDRQAYDAFEHGTPISDLISGKIVKDRFDEASLVQEFKTGNPSPETPAALESTEIKATGSPQKTAILTDHVLQRALHLHQALLALRRSI